jgi:hypothetical protein
MVAGGDLYSAHTAHTAQNIKLDGHVAAGGALQHSNNSGDQHAKPVSALTSSLMVAGGDLYSAHTAHTAQNI